MKPARLASFASALALSAIAPLAVADLILPAPPPQPAPDQPERRRERDRDELGWYVPDFARLQTGGWVGMVAVGIGYAAFEDILNLSAHYGFTPAEHAGTNIHAMSFELVARPFDFPVDELRVVPIYFGPGLLYVWGDDFFTRVPDRYAQIDSRYYRPTALQWTARLGAELDWIPRRGFFERHGLFYEAVLLGRYFELYLDNRETLDLVDVFGGALGYRVAF